MIPLFVTLTLLLPASPPVALPSVQQVWLNPDLVSRMVHTSRYLVLGTSGGVLFLDPQSLQEEFRVPEASGEELPYPVVVDLAAVGDTLWAALWKHGVAVGTPATGTYTFRSYDGNPSFFPALKSVRHLAVADSFFVEITDTLLAVFHTRHTARPDDDELVFYRFAGVPPFEGTSEFLSVAASPDSLYVGTDHGLYAAPWEALTADSLWHLRYPTDTVFAVAWQAGWLAVGTGRGAWYRDTLYAQGLPVGMVAFTGDTLYLDPKRPAADSQPRRLLPSGTEEVLDFPEDARDVRDVMALEGRVVYALGYGDTLDPAWENYNIGRALMVEQNGQWQLHDLAGPSVGCVISLDFRNGRLWTLGSQEGRPAPYPVSFLENETWQVASRSWIPTPRHLVTFPGGALVSSWHGSQGGLYVFDTLGTFVRRLQPADPVVTALQPLDDTSGLLATYGGDVYRYRPDTLIYLGHVGGGGDAFPYALAVDRQGRVWVGRYAGFSVYESLSHLDHLLFSDGGRVPAAVSSMAEDPSGRMWLGTFNGLYVVENQVARQVSTVPAQQVYEVQVVLNRLVLLAEEGVGFYTVSETPEEIAWITQELPDTPRPDPMTNPYLFSPRHALVLDLAHNAAYVGTNKGVARLDLGDLFSLGGPANGGVRVYPNPLNHGQSRFQVVGSSPMEWLGLFRLTGQRVSGLEAEEEIPGTLTVRGTETLSPGLYVGVVRTGDGRTHTFKLAVTK